MEPADVRRAIEEEWVTSVAVGLIVVCGALAATYYAFEYDPELAFGISVWTLIGAGLMLGGALLFLDLSREVVAS